MDIKIILALFMIILFPVMAASAADTLTAKDANTMLEQAKKHVLQAQYKEAIKIADQILETFPNNISTLQIKGLAQSNLGEYEKSLQQFFRVLQYMPNDPSVLAAAGTSFGYLGEYHEAQIYFRKAMSLDPENKILQNYDKRIKEILAKYPYVPTQKPPQLPPIHTATDVLPWVKDNVQKWSQSKIRDSEFVMVIKYLASNQIIKVPKITQESKQSIPVWAKANAQLWAQDTIRDDEFFQGLQYLIENKIIHVNTAKTQKDLDDEFSYFKGYLYQISKNITDEKRYIEFPNPSKDVIKKFLRDYVIWNFEQEVKNAATDFPSPTYSIVEDTMIINYIIYVNEQPTGLPLDHVGTLKESIDFWESRELVVNDKKAKIKFYFTNIKHEANVWVTWVVRDLGDGILGHAQLGKGVVEVTLGDHKCDGDFQLYDVDSVEHIMRHELGHSVGLEHANEPDNIMYRSYSPGYAYCLR